LAGVSRHTVHVLLTLTGLTAEVVGLSWVVADASRARREEFGEVGLARRTWRRVYGWFAFWLGPPSQPVEIKAAAMAGHASGSGNLVMGVSNETEVERLRREVDELTAQVTAHVRSTGSRFDAVHGRVNELRSDFTERVGTIEAQQRELRRSALRGEVRGARLFALGAILSAAANLV
jgi:hypothetical protein